MRNRPKTTPFFKGTPCDRIDSQFDSSEPILGARTGKVTLRTNTNECDALAKDGAYMKKSSWDKMWAAIEGLERIEKELHALAEGLR